MSEDTPAHGRNEVVCPRCGEVKLQTPPGTLVLPTLGMARKAAGAGDVCECGKRRFGDGPAEGAEPA
jgi:hypothetical protein